MGSTQAIKRRIKAVTNTAQITRAMEMVAANKMRKAQLTALNSRPYAVASLNLLKELSERIPYTPPLMQMPKTAGPTLIVLIAADKGLAGSFNSNIFRTFERNVPEGKNYVYAAVGKKAEEYLIRKKLKPIKTFIKFGDYAKPEETLEFARFVIGGFLEKEWGGVTTISTHFRTTLRQDVLVQNLLPISYETLAASIKDIAPEYGRFAEAGNITADETPAYEYRIEPTAHDAARSMVNHLTEHLVQMVVYHLILESNASEHSARMVAMKNASDNAKELEDDLTLLFNKSRQAAITQEITEITAGAM